MKKFDWSIFYSFKDPLGSPDCKIGITTSPRIRLSSYQASYSRNSHIACFDLVYIGSKETVLCLERTVKKTFDWEIERDDGGVTEWISNRYISDIEKDVDEIIEGWRFKMVKADKMFYPLTIDNLEDFIEYYQHVGIS